MERCYHESVLYASTAVVFLAYSVLLGKLIYTRNAAVFPFFSAYLALWLIRLPIWLYTTLHPGLGVMPYFEPFMIGLKLCMFVEGFAFIVDYLPPREAHWLIGLGASFAVFVGMVTLGLHHSFYLAFRSHYHTTLASSAMIGFGCLWISPVDLPKEERRHATILTLYFVNLAIGGLTPARTALEWHGMNLPYFAGSLACALLWMSYGCTRRMALITNSKLSSRWSRRWSCFSR